MIFKLVKPLMIALLISACSPEMVALNVAPTVISAGIDVVQKISSSNTPSSTQSLSSPSSQFARKLAGMSEQQICRAATSNGRWETLTRYQPHVVEAKRRGLSCGVSKAGSSTQTASLANLNDFRNSPDNEVCVNRFVNNNARDEAKRRGV